MRVQAHLVIEVDFHKLAKSTAVVVSDSLGVSEGLQQRIGCTPKTFVNLYHNNYIIL